MVAPHEFMEIIKSHTFSNLKIDPNQWKSMILHQKPMLCSRAQWFFTGNRSRRHSSDWNWIQAGPAQKVSKSAPESLKSIRIFTKNGKVEFSFESKYRPWAKCIEKHWFAQVCGADTNKKQISSRRLFCDSKWVKMSHFSLLRGNLHETLRFLL